MFPQSIGKITVIGPGLLGCSLGLALRDAGYGGRLVGLARRSATLDAAIARRGIDVGARDLADACEGADLIVLATPVAAVLEHIDRLVELDPGAAVITDVGSTKRSIVERAAGRLSRFVGSHPMAGAEASGPGAADAELYAGRPCIVTPHDAADPEALERVEALWRTVGMHVHRMDAADHDRAVAQISHLPHALSVVLMQLAEQSGRLDVASTGLADMTRLAAGDLTMWADIFTDNRQALVEAIDRYMQRLDRFRSTLTSGDRAQLEHLLDQARQARRRWRPQSPQDAAEPSSGDPS
ncbi:MAG: prephenate dehydrogenase/arogenate dehydrogenase family protein [Alphaproteobacteria bacterium]|jgi:prephenate dehydrogenase|nr:prephenate dehydrogenase/arogenate dehydrogenase family protein [Alphaproteobacteria bacterium]